jgi:hypothetical protein
MKIKKISVVEGSGTDLVTIFTDLPPALHPALSSGDLTLTFNAMHGTGAEYVRRHFNIEPEIIGEHRK